MRDLSQLVKWLASNSFFLEPSPGQSGKREPFEGRFHSQFALRLYIRPSGELIQQKVVIPDATTKECKTKYEKKKNDDQTGVCFTGMLGINAASQRNKSSSIHLHTPILDLHIR